MEMLCSGPHVFAASAGCNGSVDFNHGVNESLAIVLIVLMYTMSTQT